MEMSQHTPWVTVIVPVYNSAKYLDRCIGSIIAQTFQDFELLLIDDGSIDSSGQICENYALKDCRIKTFHKENAGVSSARNLGLHNAIGKWVTFVDSDDSVKPDYLRHLLEHTNDAIDLVISYAEVHNHSNIKVEVYPSQIIQHNNFEKMFIDNDMHWHTAPWSKLFRREIIVGYKLAFCEGMHICEDALFVFSYMLYSRSIYISSDTDYCYYAEMENSLTKKVNSLSSELLTYNNIRDIISVMIAERGIKAPKAIRNLNWLMASNTRRVLDALYNNKTALTKRIEVLKSIDLSYYWLYIGKRSRKEEFLKMLLRLRLIYIYDCVRYIKVKWGRAYGSCLR